MGNPAATAPTTQRSNDTQRRLARLDRVVEQLRALERDRDAAGPRGRELAEAVRAWEREATATRRGLSAIDAACHDGVLDTTIPLAEASHETRTITLKPA